MALGERIATLRKKRGWTQGILAEKVGVHSNHITRWETNRMRPSITTLRRIAEALGVTLDELLDEEQPTPAALADEPELVEKLQQLQELAPQDRAMVFRMIDTLATQKRLEKLLATAKTPL